MMVRIAVEDVFTNWGRYIHKYERHGTSEYVPVAGQETPISEWKRLDFGQDVLPAKDQGKAEKADGTITYEDYRDRFWRNLD